MVNYTVGMMWLSVWPLLIYVSYKFIAINIAHFEENINKK